MNQNMLTAVSNYESTLDGKRFIVNMLIQAPPQTERSSRFMQVNAVSPSIYKGVEYVEQAPTEILTADTISVFMT